MPRVDAIRQVQITEQTFYRWRKQYGGMGTDQLRELMRFQIRVVLSTVSTQFADNLFLRFDLMKKTPIEIEEHLNQPANRLIIGDFVQKFAALCG